MATATTTCKRVFTIKNDRGLTGLMQCSWQKSSGGLLASSIEGNPIVYIHNRQGNIFQQIAVQGNCIGLAWDEDGDLLAIIVEGSGTLLLWEAHSTRLHEIDTGIKDSASCIAWSKTGKILAFASAKGNLLVYNHRSLRRVPIIGKHNKKIICAAWSNDSLLALGAADNTLSINTMDGDSVKNVSLRAKPTDMKFGQIKEDRSISSTDNTVSTIVGEKTLYMLKFEEGSVSTPMELGFQPRYGNIVTHHWHGDGYILVCFSAGFIVLVSSHHKEIGTELVLCELKTDPLRHTSLCARNSKLAVCFGDSNIQVHEASEPRTIVSVADVSDEDGRIRPAIKCNWSDDGQLLAVATVAGDLQIYLTSVPMLGAGNGSQVVALSSLTDLVLYNYNEPQIVLDFTYTLEIEPSLIVIGPFHLAACVNNRAWIYSFQDGTGNYSTFPVSVKEFNSNIHDASLNGEYIAARCGDKIYMHLFEGDGMDSKDVKAFPDADSRGFKITALAMTRDFLVYGGESGVVKVFHIESWSEIASVTTPSAAVLKGIYPDRLGTNVILVDKSGDGFLYDMPQDTINPVPSFPNRCDGILWDQEASSQHIFVTYSFSNARVHAFVLWKEVLIGMDLDFVGSFRVFNSMDIRPLCMRNGVILSQTSTGRVVKTQSVYLEKPEGTEENEERMAKLEMLLYLKKYKEAYDFCYIADKVEFWSALAKAAMESMDIETAIKAYNHVGDVAMVYSLQRVLKEEDFKVACGHVAMYLGEFDMAETLYLESTRRHYALEMRRDLHEWDQALTLAQKLAPQMIYEICREYALHHEFNGDFASAHTMFEQAYQTAVQMNAQPAELRKISEGLARSNIRCGHVKAGVSLALESSSTFVKKECAEILESTKNYEEAALLYEQCEQWDKAASLYIRMKKWDNVAALLNSVQTPKIHAQFAKAKEAEGKYIDAAQAFERSGDVDNAIRLFLAAEKPDEAIRAVKNSSSISGALHVAKYFERHGDLDTALRFLIISRCYEDSLMIAFKNGKAELYAQLIQEEFRGVVPEEFKDGMRQVAAYFEELKDTFKSGKYYSLAGDHAKAFRLLMRAAQSGVIIDDDQLMQTLINTVIASGDEVYSTSLVEYLLGEKDGTPKDPKYLLSYYIQSRRLLEASKTALIVSREEQNVGNYKLAHTTLVNTCKELRTQGMKIPKDIMDALRIVHFYIIARIQISIGSHERAARLLIHVTENISKFPEHAAQILTTCVIECQKSGMKASGMVAAYLVMKPEHRVKISDKYKIKIETLVRKSGKAKLEDIPPETSPCPFCQTKVQNYQLICSECRADIPFCIASGKHVIADDLTACPKCEFPAIKSELMKLLENNAVCPMCDEELQVKEAVQINDIRPYIYPHLH